MPMDPASVINKRYNLSLPGYGQAIQLPPQAYTGEIEGGAIPSRPGMATNPSEPSQTSLMDTLAKIYPKRTGPDPRSLAGVAANFLQGAAAGAAYTPPNAYGSQTTGGVLGGIGAIGAGISQRRAAQQVLDQDRRKLLDTVATKEIEERIKQPYELAKENRADAQFRSRRDYEFGQQKELLDRGTKLRAKMQGIPDDVADRARTQAAANVQSLGIAPGSPGYNELYLQEFGKIADQYHKTRQEPFPGSKTTTAAPAGRPVTADEFISGGGLGQ